jgi:hypothetical protein
MKFQPTFINAQNPQLTLLANFLATMASTNDEATFRVFKKLTISCEDGHIRVCGPTNQVDILIEPQHIDEVTAPTPPGRLAMLRAVFAAVEAR